MKVDKKSAIAILQEASSKLSLSEIEQEIEYLKQFMGEERFSILESRTSERSRYATLVLENIFHTQNASAIIRSAEAFGLQQIHIISNQVKFKPNALIVRGADKWLDIESYPTNIGSKEVITLLREKGYKIAAVTPHTVDEYTPQTVDISSPIALFMGTEKDGISEELKQSADYFVKIPMSGFTESLNVSVCAAIVTQTITDRVRNSNVEWQLPLEEQRRLLHRYLLLSLKDPYGLIERYKQHSKPPETAEAAKNKF